MGKNLLTDLFLFSFFRCVSCGGLLQIKMRPVHLHFFFPSSLNNHNQIQNHMKTILIPTDFYKNSGNAIQYAMELNKKIQAKAILFHSYVVPMLAGEVPA